MKILDDISKEELFNVIFDKNNKIMELYQKIIELYDKIDELEILVCEKR